MYMFFLFNDALVWTQKKTEVPKILKLWSCNVVKNSSRKFKLQTKGQFKTLNLECTSEAERDEWYDAVDAAIARSNENDARLWSKFDNIDENAGDITRRTFSLYHDHKKNDTSVSKPDVSNNGRSRHEIKSQASEILESSKTTDDLALETVETGTMTCFSAPKAAAAENRDDEMKRDESKSTSSQLSPHIGQKIPVVKLETLNENPSMKNSRKPSCIRIDEDFESVSVSRTYSSRDQSVKRGAGSNMFIVSLSEEIKLSPDTETKDSSRRASIGDQFYEKVTPKHKKSPSSPAITLRRKNSRSRSVTPQKHKKTTSFSMRLGQL